MIGSAVVSLPWAFQQSGLLLGLIISFTSFFISFYTCKLIIDATGDDNDYSDTLHKYYGKKGQVVGIISGLMVVTGAVIVYYVIMT